MGASMIAFRAFAIATGLVTTKSLTAAIGDVLPPHRRELIETNRRCLERGAEYVRQAPAAASGSGG